MCEQCQGFDDEDDADALAAAFLARQQKPAAKTAPVSHALSYRKGPAFPLPKDKPNA